MEFIQALPFVTTHSSRQFSTLASALWPTTERYGPSLIGVRDRRH